MKREISSLLSILHEHYFALFNLSVRI